MELNWKSVTKTQQENLQTVEKTKTNKQKTTHL